MFKYKNSTNGYFENFSHFEIEKNKQVFWIVHNLKTEHVFYGDCFITPDIVVVNSESIKRKMVNKTKMDVVENDNMITFFEVKQMVPFPELIASFIGLLHCLAPEFVDYKMKYIPAGAHISPGLLCSGHGSKHVLRFIECVENDYCVNIKPNMSFKTLKAAVRKNEVNLFNDRYNYNEEKHDSKDISESLF